MGLGLVRIGPLPLWADRNRRASCAENEPSSTRTPLPRHIDRPPTGRPSHKRYRQRSTCFSTSQDLSFLSPDGRDASRSIGENALARLQLGFESDLSSIVCSSFQGRHSRRLRARWTSSCGVVQYLPTESNAPPSQKRHSAVNDGLPLGSSVLSRTSGFQNSSALTGRSP